MGMWAEFKFIPTLGAADKFEFEIKYFGRGQEPKAAVAADAFRSSPHDVTGLSFDGIEAAEGVILETARHIIFSARMLHGPNEDIEKEIKMRVTHLYDETTYLKHQINVQVLSSPLKQDSTTPMKFVFDSVVFIPDFLTKFVEATPVHKEPELFSRAELKFGYTEKIERFALIKLFWKRELTSTTSRRLLEATSPYTFSKHVPEMYRSVSAMQGIVNSTLLHKMFHEVPTNMPLVFTAEVEYTESHVPRVLQYILPTIYEVAIQQGVPSLFSKKATVLTVPAWNQEGIMKLHAIMDPLLAQVKLSLELKLWKETFPQDGALSPPTTTSIPLTCSPPSCLTTSVRSFSPRTAAPSTFSW